jgi:hypothetical protein
VTRAMLLMLAALACCIGCATQPAAPAVRPLPDGNVLRLAVIEPELRTPNALDPGESRAAGAAAGVGPGAAGGALGGVEASLYCGPLFFVCAPVLVGGGAVIGAAAGATVGTIQGDIEALPEEQARALEAVMAGALSSADAAAKLRAGFASAAAGRWVLYGNAGDSTITLGIETLFLEQYKNDMLALGMTNWMTVQYSARPGDQSKKILVRYVGKPNHVSWWISNRGSNFRAELDRAFAEQGQAMAALIRSR